MITEQDGAWFYIVLLGIGFLSLFGLADVVRAITERREPGRKLAHVGTGLLALCFPIVFERSWPVYLMCAVFVMMLAASQKRGFWEGINGVKRTTYGSVAFPLAVAALWWLSKTLDVAAVFALPLGVLTLADPAAALIGQKWPVREFKVYAATRSLGGTLAFFVVACAASAVLVWLGLAPKATWQLTLSVAIATTVAECLSQRGWDNLWIPVAGAAVVAIASSNHLL